MVFFKDRECAVMRVNWPDIEILYGNEPKCIYVADFDEGEPIFGLTDGTRWPTKMYQSFIDFKSGASIYKFHNYFGYAVLDEYWLNGVGQEKEAWERERKMWLEKNEKHLQRFISRIGCATL